MSGAWSGALRNVVRRRRRNALSVAAVATGAAAVVVMVGFTFSSAERVAMQIDAYSASSVIATLPADAWDISEDILVERAAQAGRTDGAGTVSLTDAAVFPVDLRAPRSTREVRVNAVVASSQGLAARGAVLVDGALPPTAAMGGDPYTVLLGDALARELGVTASRGSNVVYLGAQPLVVVGILKDGAQNSALAASVVLSVDLARHLTVTDRVARVFLVVTNDDAAAVAETLPYVLLPERPDEVTVALPPSPEELRAQLIGDSQLTVVVVVVVMALASIFGIVSTMQIAVWERRREIGLSRALGATRREVTRGFLLEAVVIGTIGGLAGWVAGVIVFGAVAVGFGWPLVMPIQLLLVPFAGAAIGGLAGSVPAATASHVDPVELLRA